MVHHDWGGDDGRRSPEVQKRKGQRVYSISRSSEKVSQK